MKQGGLAFVMWLAMLVCGSLQAQTVVGPEGPRIALVLSGGGARGFAHIGVLRALREMRVPVDIVVGTSMGCVIGGAFAAGRSVEDLEIIVRSTDWSRVLGDRPPRDELTFRRREEDLQLPSRVEFGVDRQGLTLPQAAAGNGELELALGRLLPAGMHDRAANSLALPFRSVASDLLTGELVELSDTPLFLAMRASLSLPGVFAPVRVDQRLLVDGGLVRNLPVDIARALGADIVIAVNVGSPLAEERELGSALGVAQQMLRILSEQNVQRSLKELRAGDVLIAPDLAGIGSLDFADHARAIKAGFDATRRMADRLGALALPLERYAAHEATRQSATDTGSRALPLARIEVRASGQLNAQVLKSQTGLSEGDSQTPDEVRQAAAKLYRRADVARVDTQISDQGGQRSVMLDVSEADWARSRLRVGLELSSDFADNNSFGVVAMHVVPSLNAWGAELRTVARIGSKRSIASEWWQPLAAGSDWYLAPKIGYGASASDVFLNGNRVSRIAAKDAQIQLALGRQLADWGDMRLGYTRAVQQLRQLIPADPTQATQSAGSSRFLQLRVDTLEPIAFPVRGQLLQATWSQPLGLGAPGSLLSSQLVSMKAFSLGEWGGHVYAEWAHARQGFAPSTLGGFLRLSGSDPGSVEGSTVVLGRLVLARRIGELPTPLGAAIRAGISLETGGGFAADVAPRLHGLKLASSAFVALDTRFGPIYFAAGGTRGTGSTLYLFLGPVW